MVNRELSFEEFRKLGDRGITIIGNSAFKICPDDMQEILKICEVYKINKNDHILLPNELLSFGGIYVGYGMEYLSDYETVGDVLLDGREFNRLSVILKVLEVMFELLDNGISYVDLHVYNVLIKGDDVKVIDLNSVSLDEDDSICYGLVDFVFNTLYGDYISFFRLKNLMSDTRFSKYFTLEFREYVKEIYNMNKKINPRKLLEFMPELMDEEKNKELRKIVYQIYSEDGFKYRV